MNENIINFQNLFNNKEIKMFNKCLDQMIHSFKFLLYDNNFKDQVIKRQQSEYNIMIINKISIYDDHQLIIIFEQNIILISDTNLLNFLHNINISQETIIFSITKDIISFLPREFQSNLYKYNEYQMNEFLETINSFSDNSKIKYPNDKEIRKIWFNIQPSISSYFINKSYIKHLSQRKKNEFIEFIPNDMNKEGYIKLKTIGQGSSSVVELIYHLKLEELFAIKIFNDEGMKTFEREYNNYKYIKYPL